MNCAIVIVVTLAAGAPPDDAPTQVQIPSALLSVIKEVYVPARTSGMLAEILVREGDSVAHREPLARIEDDEAQLAKERAETELEVARRKTESDVGVRLAEKTREVSRSELDRTEVANKIRPGAIAAADVDRYRLTSERDLLAVEQARLDHGVGRLAVTLRENDLRVAVQNLERRKIHSPLAGTVVDIYLEEGEWVEPGDAVFRIIQLDRVQAESFIDDRYAGCDLLGRSALLTIESGHGQPGTFSGRVVFVSPEVDPVNAEFLVRAEFDNRDRRLQPGMRGKMTIDLTAPAPGQSQPSNNE